MRFDKVLVTIDVQLKPDVLQQYLPCSANVIGKALANIADQYQQDNKTGYYPAIDFFKSLDGVDPDLITSAEQVAWLVSKLARETIQSKLRPIFSSVSFRRKICSDTRTGSERYFFVSTFSHANINLFSTDLSRNLSNHVTS